MVPRANPGYWALHGSFAEAEALHEDLGRWAAVLHGRFAAEVPLELPNCLVAGGLHENFVGVGQHENWGCWVRRNSEHFVGEHYETLNYWAAEVREDGGRFAEVLPRETQRWETSQNGLNSVAVALAPVANWMENQTLNCEAEEVPVARLEGEKYSP